jgi:hypothetical protein
MENFIPVCLHNLSEPARGLGHDAVGAAPLRGAGRAILAGKWTTPADWAGVVFTHPSCRLRGSKYALCGGGIEEEVGTLPRKQKKKSMGVNRKPAERQGVTVSFSRKWAGPGPGSK